MTLILDDTGSICKMTISNGDKVLLRKKGSIKKLLKFVMDGTTKENVKKSINDLQSVFVMMVGNKTTITI